MLINFIEEKYIDKGTGLLGYATWGKLNDTDPEVDSPYLTCYSIVSDIVQTKKFLGNEVFKGSAKHEYYTHLIDKYIAKETSSEVLFRRFPFSGQNYIYGAEGSRPKYAHFNNPWNLSGDNTIPIIVALGELGNTPLVKKALVAHIKRGAFYQNSFTNNGERKTLPDYMLFHLSIFLRAINSPFLYPLLLLSDFLFFLNVIFHVMESRFKKDNTASELNYLMPLVQSERFYPTPWSKLAVFFYKRRGRIYNDEEPITGAVREFFTIRGDKRPPMHIILKPIINLYFGEI